MSDNIKELNAKSFDDFISEGDSVIDFWAEWCGPCKMLSPVVEEIAKEMRGKVKFGKINIEDNQEITEKWDVMSIPTLIFFKDGEQVERNSGFIEKKELSKLIKSSFL